MKNIFKNDCLFYTSRLLSSFDISELILMNFNDKHVIKEEYPELNTLKDFKTLTGLCCRYCLTFKDIFYFLFYCIGVPCIAIRSSHFYCTISDCFDLTVT